MARKLRTTPAGVALHLIQRGNNRQACFSQDQDFSTYLGCLKEQVCKHQEL